MAILDENGVPVLALAPSSAEFVADKHRAALDPDDDEQGCTGAIVYVDNPRPVGAPEAERAVTQFVIGGETLDEALKSVVGAFDQFHGHQPPRWVASTDEHLSRLLAEHYGCEEKQVGDKGVAG